MNGLMNIVILFASVSMVLGASIGSTPQQQTRPTRQIGASSFLSSALGSGVGLLPGVGSALQSPVSMLIQGPLSSSLSSISGGLINRIGSFSDSPVWYPYYGRSMEYQPQQYYRSLPIYDASAYPEIVY